MLCQTNTATKAINVHVVSCRSSKCPVSAEELLTFRFSVALTHTAFKFSHIKKIPYASKMV